MNFLIGLIQGAVDLIRRNPLTFLVILLLAVAAPSVLVGVAGFILYLLLALFVLGLILVLALRWRLARLRREMEREGADSARRTRTYTYTWRSGGSGRRTTASTEEAGDVRIYKTDRTPEKRVSQEVGEYVDFEEVKKEDRS